MTRPVQPNSERGDRANKRVAVICASLVAGMLGLAYASVPLYQMFCQATGYGGTTQRASAPSPVVLDRTITVMFDANVNGQLPWKFEPVQRAIDVKLGETAMAFYRATNSASHAITGRAVYNVTPEQAGIHFSKIDCFCFKEQTLQPGESVEMPLTFFVDPGLASDPDAKRIQTIVLSYTFTQAIDSKASDAASTETKTNQTKNETNKTDVSKTGLAAGPLKSGAGASAAASDAKGT